jgi:hypothetical protein
MLLAGGQVGVVTLSGEAVADSQPAPGTAAAGITIDADGKVYATTSVGTSQIDTSADWVRPLTAASAAFEVRATLNSGTLAAGTVDTWLTLGSDRTWSVQALVLGSQSANLTLAIRYAGGPIRASSTYTLSAEVI